MIPQDDFLGYYVAVRRICPTCRGTPNLPGSDGDDTGCPTCAGNGWVQNEWVPLQEATGQQPMSEATRRWLRRP